MFTLHVTIVVVADRQRPTPVQLGRVAQRQRHVPQALVRARGQQSLMEPRMGQRPLFAHHDRISGGLHRGAVERVVGSDDIALPRDVAVFDRHTQDQAFELGQVVGIFKLEDGAEKAQLAKPATVRAPHAVAEPKARPAPATKAVPTPVPVSAPLKPKKIGAPAGHDEWEEF